MLICQGKIILYTIDLLCLHEETTTKELVTLVFCVSVSDRRILDIQIKFCNEKIQDENGEKMVVNRSYICFCVWPQPYQVYTGMVINSPARGLLYRGKITVTTIGNSWLSQLVNST